MFNRFNKILKPISQLSQLNSQLINKIGNTKFSTSLINNQLFVNKSKSINKNCNVNFSTIPEYLKHKGFCNERNVYRQLNPNQPIWEHQTKKELVERQKKISTMKFPSHDIIFRSRHCDIGSFDLYSISYRIGFQNNLIHMSDFIMFNPYFKINQNLIERCLTYCKFEQYTNYDPTYKIDNWLITFYNKKQYPMTNIEYKEICNEYEIFHNMNEMSYANTDYHKMLIVKSMVQIMNESPTEFVNMENYWELAKWLETNEYTIAKYHRTIQDDNNDKIIDPCNFIIHVGHKINSKQILKILYDLAVNGGDSKRIQLRDSKLLDDFEFDNICPSNTSTYIETLGSAKIYVDLSSTFINLYKYYKANGNQALIAIGKIQQLINK